MGNSDSVSVLSEDFTTLSQLLQKLGGCGGRKTVWVISRKSSRFKLNKYIENIFSATAARQQVWYSSQIHTLLISKMKQMFLLICTTGKKHIITDFVKMDNNIYYSGASEHKNQEQLKNVAMNDRIS